MTLETTLPPPKVKPWHKCSRVDCTKSFQAYHGKRGCLCHDCDNVTDPEIKLREVGL